MKNPNDVHAHEEGGVRQQNESQDVIAGITAIASELAISYQTAQRYLKRKEIPARQLGEKWIASRSVLRQWLACGLADDLEQSPERKRPAVGRPRNTSQARGRRYD